MAAKSLLLLLLLLLPPPPALAHTVVPSGTGDRAVELGSGPKQVACSGSARECELQNLLFKERQERRDVEATLRAQIRELASAGSASCDTIKQPQPPPVASQAGSFKCSGSMGRSTPAAGRQLRRGGSLAALGFGGGVWGLTNVTSIFDAAFETGYTWVDLTPNFANTALVAEALSRAPRPIQVLARLSGTQRQGALSGLLEQFEAELGVQVWALLLDGLHPERAERLSRWSELIRIQAEGRVHAIGVSNWARHHLQQIEDAGLQLPDLVRQSNTGSIRTILHEAWWHATTEQSWIPFPCVCCVMRRCRPSSTCSCRTAACWSGARHAVS